LSRAHEVTAKLPKLTTRTGAGAALSIEYFQI
jgi:hypothetical protein